MLRFVFLSLVFTGMLCELQFASKPVIMEAGTIAPLEMNFVKSPPLPEGNHTITLLYVNQHDVISAQPNHIKIFYNRKFTINLHSLKAGISGIFVFNATFLPELTCKEIAFLRVKVRHSNTIETFTSTLGWLYFIAWSLSFYPQIYVNYKRKSVVGLSFDFISFNTFGFLMYNMFNLGMYFIPVVAEQYTQRYPRSVMPIYSTDILFSLNTLVATTITLIQCFIYYSGDQKVSLFAKVCIVIDTLITIVLAILAHFDYILWLDVLYACSYIKLSITFIKCIPQVYLNYKRKTTSGWSIGGVTLDITGGVLSILQMFLGGYNYDDWTIIIGNPTKFGLAALSIVFDVIFIGQHCLLDGDKDVKEEEIVAMQTIPGGSELKDQEKPERYMQKSEL